MWRLLAELIFFIVDDPSNVKIELRKDSTCWIMYSRLGDASGQRIMIPPDIAPLDEDPRAAIHKIVQQMIHFVKTRAESFVAQVAEARGKSNRALRSEINWLFDKEMKL